MQHIVYDFERKANPWVLQIPPSSSGLSSLVSLLFYAFLPMKEVILLKSALSYRQLVLAIVLTKVLTSHHEISLSLSLKGFYLIRVKLCIR
jgi:hypothetical protein